MFANLPPRLRLWLYMWDILSKKFMILLQTITPSYLFNIYKRCFLKNKIKVNKSLYIALFAVSGSIKRLFSIDCVNIYFSQLTFLANIYVFSIFFSIDFPQWKSVELPLIAERCLYSILSMLQFKKQ